MTHSTDDWERELKIGPHDLRKTLDVKKLHSVIRRAIATALNKEREELAQKCERAILPENAWSLGIVPHSFQATRGIMADLIRSRITKDSLQSDA